MTLEVIPPYRSLLVSNTWIYRLPDLLLTLRSNSLWWPSNLLKKGSELTLTIILSLHFMLRGMSTSAYCYSTSTTRRANKRNWYISLITSYLFTYGIIDDVRDQRPRWTWHALAKETEAFLLQEFFFRFTTLLGGKTPLQPAESFNWHNSTSSKASVASECSLHNTLKL